MEINNSISALLGNTDIYLVDQLMKGRYTADDKILDAGCGEGRNMYWFLQNNFEIFGVDSSEAAILNLKNLSPHLSPEKLQISFIEKLPFPDQFFNHVISSAVLHFAESILHFKEMIKEMHRVLKKGGTLFIRMTSDIGIEDKVKLLSHGNYHLPDGSMRFLLTKKILSEMMEEFNFSFLEPLKTVNVDDVRCMSTLVFEKK
ncbi:MAG: methyltransferase domain-containing protein [Ferruginibacter sp.]